MMILSLLLFANLAQNAPKPLLLVTDRPLDPEVVKAIKLSADPVRRGNQKLSRLPWRMNVRRCTVLATEPRLRI